MHWKLLIALLFIGSAPACAGLQIFACEPEWAALSRELAGPEARIYTATHADEDPHRIQARPSLINQLRRADVLVCTGAGLESAWLPLLLRRAANPAVLPGRSGHFLAADHVILREAPATVDRSLGDVHAQGNPHVHTDPHNIALIAAALAQTFVTVDKRHAEAYQERAASFAARWSDAITDWEERGAPLRGKQVIPQHRSWGYLLHWLGMEAVATLEPKPGLPPSAAHLQRVAALARDRRPLAILRAAYQPARSSRWLSERTDLPVVVLPFTVGGTAEAEDLFSLFDDTVQRLLEAMD